MPTSEPIDYEVRIEKTIYEDGLLKLYRQKYAGCRATIFIHKKDDPIVEVVTPKESLVRARVTTPQRPTSMQYHEDERIAGLD